MARASFDRDLPSGPGALARPAGLPALARKGAVLFEAPADRTRGLRAPMRLCADLVRAKGLGRPEDLDFIESGGALAGARASAVSEHAKERGADQLGTLGSGNHFIEVQVVEELFDRGAASAFGLFAEQIVLLI